MNLSNDFLRKNGPEVHALFTGGLPGFLLPGRARPLSGGVPVFCYHTVELELFEQDMLFLRDNGYQTMGADDLLDYILGKRDVSERTVVLSFDDGALNFYRTAFPLLCEHGQRAVLFIAPGLHRERREEGAGKRRPCSWEELDEMHGSGCVDLQSHTWVHRSLTDWPTPLPLAGIDAEVVGDRLGEELSMEDDLRRAREYIEARFGKRVRHLAWPCYASGESALALARSVGYEGFWVGTAPGHPLNVPGQSPHEIVRISGEFVRRLPGRGRVSLGSILRRRYATALRKRFRGERRKEA